MSAASSPSVAGPRRSRPRTSNRLSVERLHGGRTAFAARVARAFAVFFAVSGALPHDLGDPRHPVDAVAYLGQGWPFLTDAVRRHVRDGPLR